MTIKSFKIIGLVLFFLGVIIFLTSLSYQQYTNEKEYQDKYMSLHGGSKDSEQFYKLRKEYLTPKYNLEDYGITFFITGLVIFVVSALGFDRLRSPKKKVWIVIIGIIAAIFSNVGYVGDLFLEMYRGSYPSWADTIAIPLMGVPFLFLLSLIWVGLNLIGLAINFKTGVAIFPFHFDNLNYWYAIILLITIVLTLFTILSGYFWQVISGFLWIYFYLSIMIGIRQAKIEHQP